MYEIEICNKVRNIIYQMSDGGIDVNEIDVNTNLEMYGFDSLKIILLIVELEECFEISIEDSDYILENYASIHRICEMVVKYSSIPSKNISRSVE